MAGCAVNLFLLDKKYNPNQPRVPAGNSKGGQFASSGGSVTAYHGTREKYLDSIMEGGLTARKENRRFSADTGYYKGARGEAVFVASTPADALFYAQNRFGDAAGRGIVLKLKIPAKKFEQFKRDHFHKPDALSGFVGEARYTRMNIPPSWIKSFHEVKDGKIIGLKKRDETGTAWLCIVLPKSVEKVNPLLPLKKGAPKTLYVKRRLMNADAVRKWAASQGIATTLRPDDMHVTLAFSKAALDWSPLTPDPNNLTVLGGERSVHQFPPRTTPNGALVLKFASPQLDKRWAEFKAAGASWDFSEYQPHVTLTYSVPEANVGALEAYKGPLVFGPEEFAEVSENWANEITEVPTGGRVV